MLAKGARVSNPSGAFLGSRATLRPAHAVAALLQLSDDRYVMQLRDSNPTIFYPDHWGAYTRHLDPEVHSPGKRNTQKIERKHLTLRTRMKRLVRKTICFSKTVQMHDIVIGLFVNRYAFGLLV